MAVKSESGWRGRKPFRMLALICGLLALGLSTVVFFDHSPGPGVTLSFSGYSTNNSSGIRVAIFNVVSSNRHALLYRAMSDPEWTSLLGLKRMPPILLGGGTYLAPKRFVSYGHLPSFSQMRFEVPVPAGIPLDRRYHLTLTYCRDRGRLVQRIHGFWQTWVWRLLPHNRETFSPPGFGSRTITGPEVSP
jgi:hypothetical protein